MASLANVVLDLCRRAGLPPEVVDVSGAPVKTGEVL